MNAFYERLARELQELTCAKGLAILYFQGRHGTEACVHVQDCGDRPKQIENLRSMSAALHVVAEMCERDAAHLEKQLAKQPTEN